MHLYLATRGIKNRVDEWISHLSARFYPYPTKDNPKGLIQLAVRPIQLWEIVFPEGCKEDVLRSIFPDKSEARAFKLKYFKLIRWITKNLLGVDEEFEYPDVKAGEPLDRYNCFLYNYAIERIPIGLKKDEHTPDNHEIIKGDELL